MTTVMTLPFSRPLTRADLASVPDDGHRYELVDGVLLVSPTCPAPNVKAANEAANRATAPVDR